jgi:hypothetical protein
MPRFATVLMALAAIGAVVQAQEGGRGRRGAPPSADDAERGSRELNSLTEEFSAHLLQVQQRLKLEAAQQAAWDAFAARVQALMQDQLRGIPAMPEHEDAPHRINRRVDIVRNRLAAMEDIADAASQLYALLTAEQRKLADELLPTTVPALYSGLPDLGRGARSQPSRERESR